MSPIWSISSAAAGAIRPPQRVPVTSQVSARASRRPRSAEARPMRYSEYKCFRFRFDSGVAFVSIDHPPINLLDEVLSEELDKLGRQLEADESVRVVVLQSALPDFFIAHSGLGRVGAAAKTVSSTRGFRLTQTIG